MKLYMDLKSCFMCILTITITASAHGYVYRNHPISGLTSSRIKAKTAPEWLHNEHTSTTPRPYFNSSNHTEITTQVGSTAVLHCSASDVGENTVSWVRRKDYHLLTVGTAQYSNDQRFQLLYIKEDNDWQLHIRYVQKHDEGIYECQVSSHPPLTLIASLQVAEATSEILGGPEKYLTVGSSLRLVCILKKNIHKPSYVFWYLNDRMINYDNRVKVEVDGEVSVLFLSNLQPDSSGNYSCVPSNAKPSRIHIQILKGGEIPAAIHSGTTDLNGAFIQLFILFLLSKLYKSLFT